MSGRLKKKIRLKIEVNFEQFIRNAKINGVRLLKKKSKQIVKSDLAHTFIYGINFLRKNHIVHLIAKRLLALSQFIM